jgi:VanZ family protein
VVALIFLGGVLEILQGMLGRDMSVYDEMANSAGAILGATLARLAVEPLRKRLAYGPNARS